MKRLPAILLLVALTNTTLGASKQITVHVNGMVCDFCSTGIAKKFKAQDSVEKTEVDLGKKQVRLLLKDGKNISDDQIDELIRDSGFNVERIER